MLELKSELLYEMAADLDEPQQVGATPHGMRMIVPVTGGTVTGPKIKAEVLPFGADWVLIRPDGIAELDVRATLKTDDGELIYVYYSGILALTPEISERRAKGEDVDPSEYYFRTRPTFETGSEKYGWLNSIVCVGVGKVEPNKVRYKVYQIL